MTIDIRVICDCGSCLNDIYLDERSLNNEKEQIKDSGWFELDGYHYCGECWPIIKAENGLQNTK